MGKEKAVVCALTAVQLHLYRNSGGRWPCFALDYSMGWANNQICPQAGQFALRRIVMYNVICVNRLGSGKRDAYRRAGRISV